VRELNFQHWSADYEWLISDRVRLVKSKDFDAYAYAQVRTVEGLAQNNFVRESLGRVTAPTLIIYGSGDRLIPNAFLHGGFTGDVMRAGQEQIPGARLTELPGCGHTVQLDCAPAFNEALLGFLASPDAPK
jgi:pimeloyl-ACP methyl ester carboxylesterase